MERNPGNRNHAVHGKVDRLKDAAPSILTRPGDFESSQEIPSIPSSCEKPRA